MRAIRARADFTRRDDRFPFLWSCGARDPRWIDLQAADFYGSSSLYGFLLERGWICYGLVKGNTQLTNRWNAIEKKLPTSGKEIHFLRQGILEIPCPRYRDVRSIVIALDIPWNIVHIFFFFATCCAIRGTTIWTEFFQTVKWITFTSFPRVFFFFLSFANKKVEIFFFGDKNFFRMTESICRELEIEIYLSLNLKCNVKENSKKWWWWVIDFFYNIIISFCLDIQLLVF